MTREEARSLVEQLTEEEQAILYEQLLTLLQSRAPAERPAPAQTQEDQ